MDLRAFILAAAVAAASPAVAADWEATWAGGFENGNAAGVQVIVVGDTVIGFFVGGDYVDVTATDPVAADGSLSFTWDGGTATLAADGDKRRLTIRVAGQPDRVIEVKRDQ
jgi:hypothetical protein